LNLLLFDCIYLGNDDIPSSGSFSCHEARKLYYEDGTLSCVNYELARFRDDEKIIIYLISSHLTISVGEKQGLDAKNFKPKKSQISMKPSSKHQYHISILK